MRIMLTVAYDGTSYHGWQVQAHEEMTIEGVLNRSLKALTGEDIAVIGASRTDAGVHAKGNLCVFDTDSTIPPERFVPALNSVLPEDIRIMASERVADGFHPRRIPTRKTYCYRLYHGDICPPMERLYRHHVYGPIDTDAMKEASGFFEGEHDFASFCAAGAQCETTVRTVYDVTVRCMSAVEGQRYAEDNSISGHMNCNGARVRNSLTGAGEYIDIYVTGNGFLYNMIRIMAGTLLEVGRGRIAPAQISGIIDRCDRSAAGPTLPAKGLCLERYEL